MHVLDFLDELGIFFNFNNFIATMQWFNCGPNRGAGSRSSASRGRSRGRGRSGRGDEGSGAADPDGTASRSASGSTSVPNTYSVPLTSRHRRLMGEGQHQQQQQLEPPRSSGAMRVQQVSRTPETDSATQSSVRMPDIHREEGSPVPHQTAPHSSEEAAGSTQSSARMRLCPPPTLFLPLEIPTIPHVDSDGMPIPGQLGFTTPEQAYVYIPFPAPLWSARIPGQRTDESGKY